MARQTATKPARTSDRLTDYVVAARRAIVRGGDDDLPFAEGLARSVWSDVVKGEPEPCWEDVCDLQDALCTHAPDLSGCVYLRKFLGLDKVRAACGRSPMGPKPL